MEKLKQLSNGNYNKFNLSPSPKTKHKQQQQPSSNIKMDTKQTQQLQQQLQKQQPKVDIDFLHKVIFDINSKLDSNIYWLTTLLQNIIVSIETLNKKTVNLDQRLSAIESLKATTVGRSSSRPTSATVSVNRREFNIENDIEEDIIGIADTTLATTSTANNSINSGSLNNSGDTIIENENNKKNVLLRRRTTIQIASNENVTFRRKNRLSQPTIEQNRRFSYTPTTIKISKSPSKQKVDAESRRVSTASTRSETIPEQELPFSSFSSSNKEATRRSSQIIESSSNSTTTTNSNSATSIKQASSGKISSSSIENTTENNLKLLESKRPTDTDQESLDNFVDLPAEESETEVKESRLGIKSSSSSSQSSSTTGGGVTLNEQIVKLRNKNNGSSSGNVSYESGSTVGRSVKRFKILKDGPFEFVLDIIDSELIVMEIFEGGIIHKHGGVKVGDVLLAANGFKLNGKTFNEAQERLEAAMEDDQDYIELIVARNPEQDDEEITAL